MPTDATAYEKQDTTEQQAKHGDHQEQRQTSLAVHDVANGDTRCDTKLHGPEIERQVGDGDDPGTSPLGIVLHQPAEGQRQDEHHSKFLEDDEEGRPEVESRTTLQQREHRRDHQRRGKR